MNSPLMTDVSAQLLLRMPVEQGKSAGVATAVRALIQEGVIRAGDRLPSSRQLASDLGCARGSVSTALEMLASEGLLETRPGTAARVAAAARWLGAPISDAGVASLPGVATMEPPDVDPLGQFAVDLRACRPSLERFPYARWRRCLSVTSGHALAADYGDPQGEVALRRQIAGYLRRARGLTCSYEQVIVTNGSVQAMDLLARVWLRPGDGVAYEDPGYPLARQVFRANQATLIPVSVDSEGLDVSALEQRSGVRLAYCTPAHQFPTGSQLSLERRYQLLRWARSTNSIVVEDDYDGEFRFDGPPLAPLATLDPLHVAYCGSFSKTLSPTLRIGYAVAHPDVIGAMTRARSVSEYACNSPLQLALARFIADGDFERHVARMRKAYARKRQVLMESLSRSPADVRLTGLASGLNALAELDSAQVLRGVIQRAAAANIAIAPLSRYRMSEAIGGIAGRGPEHEAALVIGFAEPSEMQIRAAIRELFP